MDTSLQRVAINSGGGYVPGLNAMVTGVVLAANRLGIETIGIRGGYDGLLDDDAYPGGGLIDLSPRVAETAHAAGASILGSAPRHDPFRMRTISSENFVEEVDRSDELLQRLRAENIDAVISIVGGSSITGSHVLSVAFKLSRKGLPTMCIPKSVEKDIARHRAVLRLQSALGYTTETLERVATGARDGGRGDA